MEMEHINENLIKVVIDADDLESRGITFLDLVSGQEYIERFFYSILEEVDIDRHFRESEAVTFQVMPMQDGIELYISRNDFDDPEDSWSDELTKHLFNRQKKVSKNNKHTTHNDKDEAFSIKDYIDPANEVDVDDESGDADKDEIIKFNQLNDFIKAARDIRDGDLTSNLYYLDSNYYLVLDEVSEATTDDEVKHIIMNILEYGEEWHASEDYLIEHAELIRSGDTIQFFAENL